MPSVAQKLCHDFVEPTIKRSTNAGKVKSTNKYNNSSPASKRRINSPRFIHIDRQTTSSKSKTFNADGITIIKSKTSVLKSLAETAVNTFVTGPLRCDNNCVTLVRKRDNHSACKCGQKPPNTKASSKCIQTLGKDFSHTDKACIHCVETATCGTQLVHTNNSILGILRAELKSEHKQTNIGLKLTQPRIVPSIDRYFNIKRDSGQHNIDSIKYIRTPSLRFVTAKRWALSNYPTRGPDF